MSDDRKVDGGQAEDVREIDELSGVETTGHEWDGIRELNNPMPRWWLWTFYATIIWAVGYMIVYPAWPLITSATPGLLGYSSRGELQRELDRAEEARAEMTEAIRTASLHDILADETLRTFAVAGGTAAYRVNCSQCHGSGAQGAPGYPNLNDDAWIWGGDIDSIYRSIAHGVRDKFDSDTRVSEMPAFAGMLSPIEVAQTAAYVRSLSGLDSDPERAAAGAALYADNCAACHGASGEGGRDFGAPSLADALWLYGSSEAEIAQQIQAPKHGVMPAWRHRLGEDTVKKLAVFIHSLGGGE
jgi:cytochrome c oxidase cbb3-type subunit III